MATINTAALPTKSDLDSMQYVDEDSPSGSHVPSATTTTETESTESETINSEFLNDDIFGEIIGDDDDSDDQRPDATSEETGISGSDQPTDNVSTNRDIADLGSVQNVSADGGIRESGASPGSVDSSVDSSVGPVIQLASEISSTTIATVEIVWDEEAEKRKDETAFFAKLRELNVAIDTAEENLEEAKEEAKLAKATLNLAIANQKHFTSKGVQYRKKPVPQSIAEPVKPVALVESNVEGSQELKTEEPKAVPVAIPESEWRAWETETILDGIEGLGAKKRETLIEHFPTFGKLMDARTEAGKEHVSFHSLLPKGIGESIGTELINRMDKKIVPGM
jgi:hypothetical protein